MNNISLHVKNSSSALQERFYKIEKALFSLFETEINSKDSIFLKYNPEAIRKIVLFLSGIISRPVSLGFCGETASGKSTIVMDSMEKIENFQAEFLMKNIVTRINTDDYYYDRSEEVKKAGSFAAFVKNYDLDSPSAIELSLMKKHIENLLHNKSVFLPRYDMSGTAIRNEQAYLANPSPIIIAEGLFTLMPEIIDIFDFKIYVDIEKEVQKRRFYERAEQRGLGNSADKIFKNASQKAEIYILPCKENADFVLNGKVSRDKYRQFVNSFLILVEDIYYNSCQIIVKD